jgi:ribosomal-protein-alanine N-acetyltransferase
MKTGIEIQTERLILSPLTASDHKFIRELVNTEGWLQFIGDRHVHSEEDAINYIGKILSQTNLQYWVVREKQNNISAGIITFIKRDYLEHHDIGFAFLPQFFQRGYAFEATKTVLDLLKTKDNFSIILAVTKPGNLASIKLLEKLGFAESGSTTANNETLHVYKRVNSSLRPLL